MFIATTTKKMKQGLKQRKYDNVSCESVKEIQGHAPVKKMVQFVAFQRVF